MPYNYNCPYCGRQNVTSAPGNSCGRAYCNQRWREEHAGSRFLRLLGTLLG